MSIASDETISAPVLRTSAVRASVSQTLPGTDLSELMPSTPQEGLPCYQDACPDRREERLQIDFEVNH
jgi:hypothetical protein